MENKVKRYILFQKEVNQLFRLKAPCNSGLNNIANINNLVNRSKQRSLLLSNFSLFLRPPKQTNSINLFGLS